MIRSRQHNNRHMVCCSRKSKGACVWIKRKSPQTSPLTPMKSSTVWHGRSTRPSLPAGTVRKDSESLPHGRRNRLIMQTKKKSRKFPLGNSLVYISLLSVAFGRVRPVGRTLFFVSLICILWYVWHIPFIGGIASKWHNSSYEYSIRRFKMAIENSSGFL